MIAKGNVTIGLETRFGPDWPGVRCGARTKAGGECQRPAVKQTGRCTRRGSGFLHPMPRQSRPIGCVFGDETIGLTLFAAAPIVATNS